MRVKGPGCVVPFMAYMGICYSTGCGFCPRCTETGYILSFFFSRFWLVLFAYLFCCFSINMYLNNRYLIKCNKQKEKYCVCRAKIVLNILYMDEQSEFL